MRDPQTLALRPCSARRKALPYRVMPLDCQHVRRHNRFCEMGVAKPVVDPNWFRNLWGTGFHDPREWSWLAQLGSDVDFLATFGCMSSEPFFLMWLLDAAMVRTVEKDPKYISEREEEEEHLRKNASTAFEGRDIKFILADMTELNEETLPSGRFDLAFCKAVLYQIFLADLEGVQGEVGTQQIKEALQVVLKAICQMARVVKPGGLVIAIESIAVNAGEEPTPIGPLFEIAGLRPEPIQGAPQDAYCYRKPG